MIDRGRRKFPAGQHNPDMMVAHNGRWDKRTRLLFAIQVKRGYPVTETFHLDIQNSTAIGKIRNSSLTIQQFGNKGLKLQAFRCIPDAEYNFVDDTDIAGKAPEHITRIDLCAQKIPVVRHKIFLVGKKQGSRPVDICHTFHHRFLIGHLRRRPQPKSLYKGPDGIVMIGWNSRNLGINAGYAICS